MPWRNLEWWGAAAALFLQTGAGSGLGLKVVLPPAFAITVALVANNWRQVTAAIAKSPLVTFVLLLPYASVAWSMTGSLSLKRALGLTLSMALAYVLATRFTPRQLLVLAVAAIVPSLVLTILMLVVAPSMARMPDGTISGVFGHKNILGWHAAVALFAGTIIVSGRILPRRTGLAIVGMSLVCLLASGSATALLSLVVALMLSVAYGALRKLERPGRLFLVLLVLQAMGAAYFVGSEIVGPVLDSVGKDSTLTGRAPMWHLADQYIARQPLLGYGYQAFWSDGSGYGWKIRSEINWDTPNAHNGYREILLAFGIVGLLPFMAMVLKAMTRGAWLHRSAPDGSWLWMNVLIGMFLVMNATESIFFMPYSFLFIMFMTAILMITIREPDFYVAPAERLQPPRQALAAGVATVPAPLEP